MNGAPKDPASLAAQCKQMAEKASDDKREYWLNMERFWLSKIEPGKAAAVDVVKV
jgi:hypothetical protein